MNPLRQGLLGALVLLCAGDAFAQWAVEAVSVSPPKGATGVSRRPAIELVLNRDLYEGTCREATVYLSPTRGAQPTFSTSCEPRKIRFQAQGDFDANTRYEVVITIPPGPDGSTFRPIYDWTFTTGTSTLPPGKIEITSMKPAAGSVVGPSATGELRPVIELRFNRPIDVGKCASARHLISVLDLSAGGRDTGDWNHTCSLTMVSAAIHFRSHLKAGRQYEVRLAPGVLGGAAGEPFASRSYSFSTSGPFQHDTMSELDRNAMQGALNAPALTPGLKKVVHPEEPATSTEAPAATQQSGAVTSGLKKVFHRPAGQPGVGASQPAGAAQNAPPPRRRRGKGGITKKLNRTLRSAAKAVANPGKLIQKVVKTVTTIAKDPAKFVRKVVAKVQKTVKRTVAKVQKTVKRTVKSVRKAVKRAVKVIRKRIVGPILKKIKETVGRLFKPVAAKVLPMLTKLIRPLLQQSAERGGMFGVDSLERWGSYVRGGTLDVERIKREIFARISAWVTPKIKDMVASVLGKGIEFIRRLTDPIVSSALSGIGAVPFVGGLLAGLVSSAYNFGMRTLQKTLAAQVEKLLRTGSEKLFAATVGKLLGKLLPKVNRFLQRTGRSSALRALLGKVPDGAKKVADILRRMKDGARTWSPAIEAQVQELATRFVVSDHSLEVVAEKAGVQSEEPAADEAGEENEEEDEEAESAQPADGQPAHAQPAAAQPADADPAEQRESESEARALGVNAQELHAAEVLANRPPAPAVQEATRRRASGLRAKVEKVIASLFKKVMAQAMKLIEKQVERMGSTLAGTTNRVDISLVERMASFTKDGRLDTARVRAELQRFIQGFLFARIEPLVQGLVTKALGALRAMTDPIIAAAVSGLGSIPVAGTAIAAGASLAYNAGMKSLTQLISTQGMKLLRKLGQKLLGKILGKLLGPVLKSVNKFLTKTKVGRALGKGLQALQRIPGAVAKVKELVASMKARATRWTPALGSQALDFAAQRAEAEIALHELEAKLVPREAGDGARPQGGAE